MKDRFLRIKSGEKANQLWREKKNEELNSWRRRSFNYEQFLKQNVLQYRIYRGEVYEVDFGVNVGCELNARHYAVVIHNSNISAQSIVVVPLTTKIHYSYADAIELGYLEGIDTTEVSYAKISQIRTIDKARLYLRPIMNLDSDVEKAPRIGPVSRLTEEQFDKVLIGLNQLINHGLGD